MTPPHYSLAWLKAQLDAGEPLKFMYFWGHTPPHNETIGAFCLSQWYACPFTVNKVNYKTSEHWMMAQKALLFNDAGSFEKIIAAQTPGEAKDLGRQVAGFDESTWNTHRYEIVKRGNVEKFSQNLALKEYLINTNHRVLVEASPIDAIWGVGLAHDDKNIQTVHTWRGLNLLGFALMEVRDVLKSGSVF